MATITFMTYNTHLFGGSNAAAGNLALAAIEASVGKEPPRPIVFDDDTRAAAIAQHVRTSGADIVALEEVWAYSRQQWFASSLSDTYPFFYVPQQDSLVPVATDTADALQTGLDYLAQTAAAALGAPATFYKNTCGLVLLSKFPLANTSFTQYSNLNSTEDGLSQKGVISTTVTLTDGRQFRLGVTHAGTDQGGASEPNITQLITSTIQGNMPAVFMGDFNVHTQQNDGTTGPYVQMNKLFGADTVGAKDAYAVLNPNVTTYAGLTDANVTIYLEQNDLDRLFNGLPRSTAVQPEPGNRDRIDYIFTRNGSGLSFSPASATIDQSSYKYGYDGAVMTDVFSGPWQSDYVAVIGLQLGSNQSPFLLGIKDNNTYYLTKINADFSWSDVSSGTWHSDFVGTSFTSFQMGGHTCVFSLKEDNTAWVTQIADDGSSLTDLFNAPWHSDYVAAQAFELNGTPYVFSLKQNNTAFITQVTSSGFKDIYSGTWASDYIGSAVRTIYLGGHPYIFALSTAGYAYLTRINDDPTTGWTDSYKGSWASDYLAVVPFYCGDEAFTFALSTNNVAWITHIDSAGSGWTDLSQVQWQSNYVPTAIASLQVQAQVWGPNTDPEPLPCIFALKQNATAYLSAVIGTKSSMDLSDHYPLTVTFNI